MTMVSILKSALEAGGAIGHLYVHLHILFVLIMMMFIVIDSRYPS
jgi:hypothetical protein